MLKKNFNKLFLVIFLTPAIMLTFFAKTGEEIYKNYCVTCHSPQMAKLFQAPAAHSEDWLIRKDLHLKALVENDSSLLNANSNVKEIAVINSLADSAIKGTTKGMPPKGTCTDCSKEELKSAITFMLSH